jgi:hypothetical protein
VERHLAKPSRRTLVFVAVPILLAVVALAALSAPLIERIASNLFGNAPSIDWLVSNYKAHQSQFATLTRMTATDSQFELVMTKRGAYLQSEWADALTQRRIKQYEAQLRPVGGITLDWDSQGINITLGQTGLAIAGDTWGYWRSDQPPAQVVTLKQAHAFFHNAWCYPLGDGWYAYNFND